MNITRHQKLPRINEGWKNQEEKTQKEKIQTFIGEMGNLITDVFNVALTDEQLEQGKQSPDMKGIITIGNLRISYKSETINHINTARVEISLTDDNLNPLLQYSFTNNDLSQYDGGVSLKIDGDDDNILRYTGTKYMGKHEGKFTNYELLEQYNTQNHINEVKRLMNIYIEKNNAKHKSDQLQSKVQS